MIRPTLQDFLAIARPGQVVAITGELPSDRLTPVDAFYATGASYLLESAEKGMQIGRYSFLGVEPEVRLEIRGETCRVVEDGQERTFQAKDPLRILGEMLKARPYVPTGDLPPFPGGAVGYVGYEAVARYEKLDFSQPKPALGLPDSVFLFTRYTIAFDNLMHTMRIICNLRTGEDLAADYQSAVDGIQALKEKLLIAPDRTPEAARAKIGPVTSSFMKEKFLAGVEALRAEIAAGEAIQVVLSQRLQTDYTGDPFLIYRSLRSINPSPYMFYLDLGDFAVFGASPEVMVRVEQGRALLRPIAGTRPRGKTIDADIQLKAELLADEKERAEHLMLVDLARNDLGRVAEPGTVTVDRLMDVEFYSHVMHIVSEVSARLAPRVDVFDVIRAVFPAGTVSGAPKVRAMQLIEEYEPVRRGPYAGLVGYLGYTGNFDSCITIRSFTACGGKLYLQAGAGIVHDSDPEREYRETLSKARAMLKALPEQEA